VKGRGMAGLNLLKGIKAIMTAFDLNEQQFRMFVSLGLPVCKINGRWYGHFQTIDEWFAGITNPTRTKKRKIDVPETDSDDLKEND